MGLDLLDTPVRLTWDFPDDATGQQGPSLPAVAEAVMAAGVFFVTLQGRPLLHPALEEVLDILGGGCQLLLTCCGSQEELKSLAEISPSGVQLLLNITSFARDEGKVNLTRLHKVVLELRENGYEPCLAFTPLRENLNNIPDLLSFCVEHKIPKFKLPNAHIGDSFHDYSPDQLPRWEDLEAFRETWKDFVERGSPLPELEIHDLFLWEIMTPGQKQNRAEYGGCQAGNSLGHVDCRGVVHPCAAWPQALGKLPGQSLEQIWNNAERFAVCELIAQSPEGCHGCSALDSCFGGCRGLAKNLNLSAGARDLMCSGPR
jgi:GeoRSP system SPASM domain protein